MKFEYDIKKDDRECVAYIDSDGDLMVSDLAGGAICFVRDGCAESKYNWAPENAAHKFYPGDKITITL